MTPGPPALTPDTTPETLPVLGTTWYDHRGTYWFRRVVYSLLMAITVVIETAILVGIWGGIASTPGRFVFALLEGCLTLWTGAAVFRSMRAMGRSGLHPRKPVSPTASERPGTTGSLLGVLARVNSLLGTTLLVIGSVLTYGCVLTIFLRSFLPQLDVERRARSR